MEKEILLTVEELIKILGKWEQVTDSETEDDLNRHIAKAQDAKTASIVAAEIIGIMEDWLNLPLKEFKHKYPDYKGTSTREWVGLPYLTTYLKSRYLKQEE